MNKKILASTIIFVLMILPFLFPVTTLAQKDAETKPVLAEVKAKKLDREAEILSAYLAQFNSPMQDNAQDFIDAARVYNLDWKMLPAIAGVESTFGKQIPGGYNAYGWGVYGTNVIYFDSWKDGIYTVAKGLREGYLNKGLTDPYSINRVYAASPYWGTRVSYFMNDLANFAAKYETGNKNLVKLDAAKIAAISGQLELPSD